MIERKKKLCKGDCGEMKYIWANGKCKDCHYKDKPAVQLKRTRIKTERKPTGEYALFEEIWSERKHVCQCCGDSLGNQMSVFFMSHLLGKGAYPSLRLNKMNIMLMCFHPDKTSCHGDWDTGSKDQKKFKLARLITEKLKLEYYNGKGNE